MRELRRELGEAVLGAAKGGEGKGIFMDMDMDSEGQDVAGVSGRVEAMVETVDVGVTVDAEDWADGTKEVGVEQEPGDGDWDFALSLLWEKILVGLVIVASSSGSSSSWMLAFLREPLLPRVGARLLRRGPRGTLFQSTEIPSSHVVTPSPSVT